MQEQMSVRDQGIDALRGLAIVAMVASHLAWDCLGTEPPLVLRAFGSLAAPLFITLAGMLVAQTRDSKQHSLTHYLSRGALIALVGVGLDVAVWLHYPFVEVDVLYLIGLALPLVALFSGLTAARQTLLLAILLAASELLRACLGYPDVLSFPISTPPLEVAHDLPGILRQWIVSGWFPLFPWLFFAFLGVRVFQWRQLGDVAFRRRLRRIGLCLIVGGLISAWLIPTPVDLRGSRRELFYPPTAAFVLVVSGAVLMIFAFHAAFWLKANRPLARMGQCSLLLYVTHLMLIEWIFRPLFPDRPLVIFLLLYATLLAILAGLAEAVHAVKVRFADRLPFLARFLLGG